MNERVNFVILFQGRAGSSFLVDALARVPGVVAEGEMLVGVDPARGSLRNRVRRLLWPSADDGVDRLQLTWTRTFYRGAWPGARALGFKTKVRDVYDLEGFASILAEERVRVVVLERRNLVKQAVSNLNADRLHAAQGEWNLRNGQTKLGPFEVDPARFDDMLRKVLLEHEVLDAFVNFLRLPILRLDYEGLLRDRNAWFGAVCEFLGLGRTEPVSGVSKNTEDDLRRVLLNFDALRAGYTDTPFAAMFDDAMPSPERA